MTARRCWTLLVALLVPAAVACSSDESTSAPEPSERASVSSAPPAPAAPAVGSCHRLTLSEATDPVDPGTSVPCGQRHTSVTVAVGRLAPLADGHLLAVDSPTVRARLARACPKTLARYVGGDRTTRRLSRLEVLWFAPSLKQADAGANWYRCDVVALRKKGVLLPLARTMKGVLDKRSALDRYGTCGTAAPDARSFERVACAHKHSWRAVDVIDLPRKAHYLGKGAGADADAACKDVAAARANGALKYTWSFEWPTPAQWKSGQRYGYCWVPAG